MKSWVNLPDKMRTPEVKPYYDALVRKKGSLLAKKVFDFVAAFVALAALSPAFLILAAIIKIDSPGPVFFRQVRVTQYGKEFRIFKFRTMVANAEKMGSQVTVNHDDRITKVGSFIRKCRLDEIPQLLNILTGDMSFVGTRPEVKKFIERYTPEMMATLLLPAGVTSLASINYRDEAALLTGVVDADDVYAKKILPCKMKYNLQAIKDFDFWNEIKIMFMTVGAVLR